MINCSTNAESITEEKSQVEKENRPGNFQLFVIISKLIHHYAIDCLFIFHFPFFAPCSLFISFSFPYKQTHHRTFDVSIEQLEETFIEHLYLDREAEIFLLLLDVFEKP